VFTTSSCNPTLGSSNPANLVGTSVIKQPNNASVSLTVPPGVVAMNGGGPTMYSLCLYDGSGPSGGLLSMAPYNVNAVSLSPASGSYLSSVLVTASSPMAFLSGVTAPVVLVVGPGAGCPGIYSTSPMNGVTPIVVGSGSIRKVSSNRAIVTLPPLSLQNNQPTGYQLCFYSSNNTQSGSLMGTSSYTAGTVATPTGVIPAAGPAAGGNTITVVGSDFPTDPGRITATLGGTPLTNIQPINDKAFTALVSPHAAEDDVTLLVITPGGTKALPGAYSFTNPIQITPTTAPNTTSSVDVDVQGSGFMSINFGSGGSAGRVFLVNGTYNGADTGGGVLANGPVAECRNALVVTDQELVCTLQLNRRLNNTATGFFDPIGYAHSVTDISTTAGSRVIGSPSGKFSPDDVGQPNLNTNIPQKSTITAVLNSKMAVMSLPSPQAGSPITATVGGVVHSLTGTLTTTSGSATVSVAAPDSFSRADIGRLFNTGTPGIPDGTTIVAVAPGGGSATLSAPASLSTQYPLAGATVADGSSTLYSSALVSNDVGSVIGPNSLGIPAGTTISTVVANTSAGLSAAAGNGGGSGTLTLNKPISASLYAAAPVLNGAYNLVVVSNGAPNAAMTDPEYSQTDVTSGSTFTVATF
jgi:hypothetical protein